MTDIDTAALDAELAEKLDLPCGYVELWGDSSETCGLPSMASEHMLPESHGHEFDPDSYSTTGDGMLMVLEAMAEKGYLYNVHNRTNGDVEAGFWLPETDYHFVDWEAHPNAPTAAALAAIDTLKGDNK